MPLMAIGIFCPRKKFISTASVAYPSPSWRQITPASRRDHPSPQMAPQPSSKVLDILVQEKILFVINKRFLTLLLPKYNTISQKVIFQEPVTMGE